MHATKIARFLIWSGNSTIPIPNALASVMELAATIHLGRDASGSGVLKSLYRPKTMSSTPSVTLITRPIVEAVLPAPAVPPNRMSPATPTTAHTAK